MKKYTVDYSTHRQAWVVINNETKMGQSFWINRKDAIRTASVLNIVAKMNMEGTKK